MPVSQGRLQYRRRHYDLIDSLGIIEYAQQRYSAMYHPPSCSCIRNEGNQTLEDRAQQVLGVVFFICFLQPYLLKDDLIHINQTGDTNDWSFGWKLLVYLPSSGVPTRRACLGRWLIKLNVIQVN